MVTAKESNGIALLVISAHAQAIMAHADKTEVSQHSLEEIEKRCRQILSEVKHIRSN